MDRCYRCSSERRLVRKLDESTEYACLECGAYERQLNQDHLAKCFTEAENHEAAKRRVELEKGPPFDFKITRWMVSVGDKVQRGEHLFDGEFCEFRRKSKWKAITGRARKDGVIGEFRRKSGWKPITGRPRKDGVIVELLVSADPTGQTIHPGRTPTFSMHLIDGDRGDEWHFATDPENARGPYR